MRLAFVLVLAACDSDVRVGFDSLVPSDGATADADEDVYNRVVNRVLVTGDFVYWSHGQEGCHLENPCANDGPGMTSMAMYNGRASVFVEGGVGTRFVSGTRDQMFFVTGQSPDLMYVQRWGTTGNAGMSIPRRETVGPAVDATHVYWAEWSFTPTSESYTIKRTSKDGDGSVVEELATASISQIYKETELVHAGGFIWWGSSNGIRRVPVTGGTVERVSPQPATAMVATDDALYVGARLSDPVDHVEIHRVALDGTTTPLVTDAPVHLYKTVRFMLVVEDRVWWTVEDGNIYNVPITGGEITTIPVGEDAGRAFVVLPNKLLVDLGFRSYREIPR